MPRKPVPKGKPPEPGRAKRAGPRARNVTVPEAKARPDEIAAIKAGRREFRIERAAITHPAVARRPQTSKR